MGSTNNICFDLTVTGKPCTESSVYGGCEIDTIGVADRDKGSTILCFFFKKKGKEIINTKHYV
jgi:hypothetical protein